MRASCRHRTAYRWQSFATDILPEFGKIDLVPCEFQAIFALSATSDLCRVFGREKKVPTNDRDCRVFPGEIRSSVSRQDNESAHFSTRANSRFRKRLSAAIALRPHPVVLSCAFDPSYLERRIAIKLSGSYFLSAGWCSRHDFEQNCFRPRR